MFQRRSKKKPLVFSLMLTSLIDAFSILVIYLLAGGTELDSSRLKNLSKLPLSSQGTKIDEGLVIRVEKDGRFFLGQQETTLAELMTKFKGVGSSVVIEADRNTSFRMLSPLVAAASRVGLETFEFAVIKDRRGRP